MTVHETSLRHENNALLIVQSLYLSLNLLDEKEDLIIFEYNLFHFLGVNQYLFNLKKCFVTEKLR
jgi:hypothetical protein